MGRTTSYSGCLASGLPTMAVRTKRRSSSAKRLHTSHLDGKASTIEAASSPAISDPAYRLRRLVLY